MNDVAILRGRLSGFYRHFLSASWEGVRTKTKESGGKAPHSKVAHVFSSNERGQQAKRVAWLWCAAAFTATAFVFLSRVIRKNQRKRREKHAALQKRPPRLFRSNERGQQAKKSRVALECGALPPLLFFWPATRKTKESGGKAAPHSKGSPRLFQQLAWAAGEKSRVALKNQRKRRKTPHSKGSHTSFSS